MNTALLLHYKKASTMFIGMGKLIVFVCLYIKNKTSLTQVERLRYKL